MLQEHLVDTPVHHEDTFILSITGSDYSKMHASRLLESTLEGFMLNAPKGVSRIMFLRNILVKPLGLRTSPLGCPVSSLLSEDASNLFADQYPVLSQRVNDTNTFAQVVLGADDKHLKFRACVSAEIIDNDNIEFTLGNRVHCNNLFGRFYMHLINYVHRHYISPTMLRRAVDYVVLQENLNIK